jgi:hypothetical protein
MLAHSYQKQINQLIRQLGCRIQLPHEWQETFFAESGVQPTTLNERRRFVRHRVRTRGILTVRQTLPNIPRGKEIHTIYTFNVSRSGFSFIHSEQLFPLELCDLCLPTQKLTVEVARCQFINERCYLIGGQPVSE